MSLKAENQSPVSVCMVSAAEAQRIGRALASVAGWTREIIVVLNTEVQDGTEEIALKHGAKVFREPWKGMIGQKNSAAEKANNDWILDVDADEEVSDKLRAEIQSNLAGSGPSSEITALSYPRLSWYCGRWIKHGDWYPDRQTRLWRRGRARWGGTDPHAKLLVEGRVQRLQGDLHHYSSGSINRHLEKIMPFSDEFVRQHLNGREPGVFEFAARPFWRFVRAYFLKLGFLDGWPGFYIASQTAFATLVRYAKVREAKAREEQARRLP